MSNTDHPNALPVDSEEQDQMVRSVLEQAYQKTKAQIKKELGGEVVAPEILSLRLKGRR